MIGNRFIRDNRSIFQGDCSEILKEFNDNTFDIVITSPPYNMNLRIRNGKYCSRQIVKEISTKYNNFSDNLPIDSFYDLHRGIIHNLIRVSELVFYNISIVTGSKRAFFKLIGYFSDNLKEIIVWDKKHGQPSISEGTLNRRTELLLVFSKDDDAISRRFKQGTFKKGTLEDIWQIGRGKKIDKTHSAVFPEELVEKILFNFSSVGDKVLDPFMGSGTTAVVCDKLDRHFTGIEINEKYCDLTIKRILQAKNNLLDK